MTLWYLIGTLVVLGLALLTVTGSGGPAPELVIWIGRVLPAVSALVFTTTTAKPIGSWSAGT